MTGVVLAVLVFVGGPLMTWGIARVLSRLMDEQWLDQTDEWDEQVEALRVTHLTPGGLGDDS